MFAKLFNTYPEQILVTRVCEDGPSYGINYETHINHQWVVIVDHCNQAEPDVVDDKFQTITEEEALEVINNFSIKKYNVEFTKAT